MVANQSWFDRDLLLSKAKEIRKCKSNINKINVMIEDIIRNTGHSEFSKDEVRELIYKVANDLELLSITFN